MWLAPWLYSHSLTKEIYFWLNIESLFFSVLLPFQHCNSVYMGFDYFFSSARFSTRGYYTHVCQPKHAFLYAKHLRTNLCNYCSKGKHTWNNSTFYNRETFAGFLFSTSVLSLSWSLSHLQSRIMLEIVCAYGYNFGADLLPRLAKNMNLFSISVLYLNVWKKPTFNISGYFYFFNIKKHG